MLSAPLCQVWNVTTSLSAIGAFAAGSKPPQRTLSCLRNTSRDIRLLVADQLLFSPVATSVALQALSSSQPAATSLQSPVGKATQLSAAINKGQLDLAVTEYKRLHSRRSAVQADLVEELITGAQNWQQHFSFRQ